MKEYQAPAISPSSDTRPKAAIPGKRAGCLPYRAAPDAPIHQSTAPRSGRRTRRASAETSHDISAQISRIMCLLACPITRRSYARQRQPAGDRFE